MERSDDLKGYLFLDTDGTCGIVDVVKGYLFLDAIHVDDNEDDLEVEDIDDVKSYLFLDAVLQLTESVLLLLRQLPIWTLHRLA